MSEINETASEQELYQLWGAYVSHLAGRALIEDAGDCGRATAGCEQFDYIDAMDALRINRLLIDSLIERRGFVVRLAKATGYTWAEIGSTLGISEQSAQDQHRRRRSRKNSPAE